MNDLDRLMHLWVDVFFDMEEDPAIDKETLSELNHNFLMSHAYFKRHNPNARLFDENGRFIAKMEGENNGVRLLPCRRVQEYPRSHVG